MSFKSFVVAALAATASAHMVLKEPKPFPVNSSPLNEDGSDYPCKVTSYEASSRTEYQLGSTQTLRFQGSAVHGGGSCQVSITYDKNPTTKSAFKVIHSIEGGCPAKNLDGNLPANPTGDAPDGYDFKIPADLPTGDAILSWTWFNRRGNREMYMNCAPIKITGSGSSDISTFNKLPDIMVANIGAKMCKIPEGTDVKFPNPGKSISSFPYNGKLQDVSNQPGCSYNWMAGSNGPPPPAAPEPSKPGYDESPAPAPTKPGYDESPAPAPTVSSPAVRPALPGGGFLTVTTNGSSKVPTKTSTASSIPISTQTAAPAPVNPDASCLEGSFLCTGVGFKQCVDGKWSIERALSAGTRCNPGVTKSLEILAGRSFNA